MRGDAGRGLLSIECETGPRVDVEHDDLVARDDRVAAVDFEPERRGGFARQTTEPRGVEGMPGEFLLLVIEPAEPRRSPVHRAAADAVELHEIARHVALNDGRRNLSR